ncbi:MAG TPA: hypothetical protein VLJ15_06010 [Gammaproteobacteria bacterium]|nr:hypothetical protein [Gammaproteobacteria bacterium]
MQNRLNELENDSYLDESGQVFEAEDFFSSELLTESDEETLFSLSERQRFYDSSEGEDEEKKVISVKKPAPSLSPPEKDLLLKKMVEIKSCFTGLKSGGPKNREYYTAWFLNGGGKEFEEKIMRFNENFKNLLAEQRATVAFEETLSGSAFFISCRDKRNGLDQGDTGLLSDFLDDYPVVAHFLHRELVVSEALKEVIDALQKFTTELEFIKTSESAAIPRLLKRSRPDKPVEVKEPEQSTEELMDFQIAQRKYDIKEQANKKLREWKEEPKNMTADRQVKINLMSRTGVANTFLPVGITGEQYAGVYQAFHQEGLVIDGMKDGDGRSGIKKGEVIPTILGRLNVHAAIQAQKTAAIEPAGDVDNAPQPSSNQPGP